MTSILRRLKDGLKPERRCANCGNLVRGKGLRWKGRVLCSRRCKREYREKHKRSRSKLVFLPSDTFEAIYWRRD